MDFFKSVFADDPDPTKPQLQPESDTLRAEYSTPDSSPKLSDPDPNASGWSFGGLFKTIATRSESVIETYRRDLEEFGVGLKKEIEVAQGSLGNVGQVIDEFGNTVIKGTTQIINQGKEAILVADNESDSPSSESKDKSQIAQRSLNSNRYSRFDAQARAIQGDINTYIEEPEDLEYYKKWKAGFDLRDKEEEIERLMEENGEMESVYKRVVGVSNGVDHETFWCRYFYKVCRLKQAEDARIKLVKRAISREEEEDLSWDVDEDEDEEEVDERNVMPKVTLKKQEDVEKEEKDATVEQKAEETDILDKKMVVEKAGKGAALESEDQAAEKVKEMNPVEEPRVEWKGNDINLEKNEEACKDDSVAKSVQKVVSEGNGKNEELKPSSGSGKDSDFSVVSSHPSMAEEDEDLGWDEIEDLSIIDDKKGTHSGNPSSSNRADLRKRLSTAEEDEDLSWDIEDDDEPVKS
ncbi:BSD domain-containing protein 1-like isoform X3 [Hibiscus syriacus]|uniref:BSD domain-containing protein 1-like isoform X3 n=1 Tax=Hibiscus syriacus TaxID=106335 RepID=UPI001922B7C5|nr:BSD domain-containing protein 1-like isoform X3 [Hibiscus syriacus]